MTKDPAVLLYTGDFLIGVSDMPFLERGYYITLLCLQHQKGHLSEETICFSLGLSSVSEIPNVIKKFEVDDEGKYYQHRMESETEKRAAYSESRRNNGGKGGRPSKNQNGNENHMQIHMQNHMQNHMDNHMPNHMPNHMGNENENENRDRKGVDILPLSSEETKGARTNHFTPPTADDVAEYCKERGNNVNPQRFVDFYASKGWMVGSNKMKDWKAAVRTWEKEDGGAKSRSTGNDKVAGRNWNVGGATTL